MLKNIVYTSVQEKNCQDNLICLFLRKVNISIHYKINKNSFKKM